LPSFERWLQFFLTALNSKKIMKMYLLVLLTTLSSFTKFSDEPVDRIGVKGPLTFNKATFNLAWTSQPSDNYYIQEYLPESESAHHFNQMLSIFLLVGDTKLKNAVQQKINELDTRKKTDPTCNYMVVNNPDKTEYMVDFVLGEGKNDKMEVEEFNIYRYKQVDLGDKKKGILVYAYSKRAYGSDITPFFMNLKGDRIDLLKTMIASDMPVVKISDN
jgi:hypothetical protein